MRSPATSARARALVTLACGLGLASLALMALSVLVPRPLPIIAALSLGHAMGLIAFACYLGAIVVEVRRNERNRRSGAASNADELGPSDED